MGVPPLDVGGVAKGAAHHGAGSLVRLSGSIGEDRNLPSEGGHDCFSPHQAGIALVSGVDDDGDAGGQELGSRRRNGNRSAAEEGERNRDELACSLQVFDLGLGNGGATLGAPDHGSFRAVGSILPHELEKGALCGPA